MKSRNLMSPLHVKDGVGLKVMSRKDLVMIFSQFSFSLPCWQLENLKIGKF